jgi:hypothetical protein
MDAPLRQRMTDERWREKAEAYVAKMGVIQGLKDDKAAENKRRQEEIERLEADAEQLRLELVEGVEGRRQGDLFAGEERRGDPTPAEANQALAAVAGRVEPANKNQAPEGKPASGFDFDETEPAPSVDRAQAGPTKVVALTSPDAGDGDEDSEQADESEEARA